MSYTIVYSRQFLKAANGKIIPLVLMGSNNCWETRRNRRARDWNAMYFSGSNALPTTTPEAFLARVKDFTGPDSYNEHFKYNGKYVDDAALIRFAENGIKGAKSLEELNAESRINVRLEAGFSVYYDGGRRYSNGDVDVSHRYEHHRDIMTNDELEAFLKKAEERIAEKTPDETVYVSLRFPGDKAVEYPIAKKTRNPKQRPEEYYAVRIDDYSYLSKLTAGRIHHSSFRGRAKPFSTYQEAEKWIDKHNLRTRFNVALSIEHVSPATQNT